MSADRFERTDGTTPDETAAYRIMSIISSLIRAGAMQITAQRGTYEMRQEIQAVFSTIPQHKHPACIESTLEFLRAASTLRTLGGEMIGEYADAYGSTMSALAKARERAMAMDTVARLGGGQDFATQAALVAAETSDAT